MGNSLRWQGQTVACIASGPSLTVADCEAVKISGIPTIAVNNSWQRAPFASVIYAGDCAWWKAHIKEIDIPAEKWSCSRSAVNEFKVLHHSRCGAYNSGLAAIELAIEFGAAKIILLGYDCTTKYGTHWHGDHTMTANPNANKCNMWKKQFTRLSKSRATIINCSRVTALECFIKKSLEEVLTC